jgi:hypothetical protein
MMTRRRVWIRLPALIDHPGLFAIGNSRINNACPEILVKSLLTHSDISRFYDPQGSQDPGFR